MEKKIDWEKEIDWYGLFTTMLSFVGILALAWIWSGALINNELVFTTWDREKVHIILSIIMFISGVIMGEEHLDSRNDDYYKPSIIGYVWAVLLVILFLYV